MRGRSGTFSLTPSLSARYLPMDGVNMSELVRYEDALVIGKLAATVTHSGIVLKQKVRPNRDSEFGTCATQLLRQLAGGFDDEQVSGLLADVFDRSLAHGSLGELGHVRFFAATPGAPVLRAHALLIAVADRIESRVSLTP